MWECERVYAVVAVEPPRRERACQGGVVNAPKAQGNTYLRPPLNSSSKTSRHDGSAEKLGLLPETRGLFFLLYEKLLFRSSEFSVISAHGFMLVPGQSSAEYQQLESILEITSPSKFQNILFQFGLACGRPRYGIVKSQQWIVNPEQYELAPIC